MTKLQLTPEVQIVHASAKKPKKLKALSAGVEVRGFGVEKGDVVEIKVPTAVAGFGEVEVIDPSKKKSAPKRKTTAKKSSKSKSGSKK